MIVGSVITDGGVEWKVVNDQGSSSSVAGGGTLPVGSIVPYLNGDILPDGYLLCDGAEVVKSEYSALYGVIGDVFGDPSDNSHFVLPDLRDKTLWGGGNNSDVGDNIDAGLPNIKGTASGLRVDKSISTIENGAMTLSLVATASFTQSGAQTSSNYSLEFDASDSNPIYSDNVDTVQPPALAVSFIIKAFGPSGSGVINTDPTKISVSYRDTFTIIYPNGGTEEQPANVATNTRYIEDNPFPGYYVNCVPEVYYNNMWAEPKWYDDHLNSNARAWGIRVSDINNDTLCIRTPLTGVVTLGGYYSGNAFSIEKALTSAPCRVKVYKIGKKDNTEPDLQEVSVYNTITVDEDQYMKNNFTIIYPNNGTAESPATISKNTRLIEANPFPGYYIHCVGEIYYNNQWGDPGWYDNYNNGANAQGVKAKFNSTNNVITIQSGNSALLNNAEISGSAIERVDDNIYTAPIRVIVWKVGKIPT